MKIWMSASELQLLKSFLHCSRSYVEFGAGGSTLLAAHLVRDSVLSVESCREWTDKVRLSCEDAATPVTPELLHADIGPTGDWGAPVPPYEPEKWARYFSDLWRNGKSLDADFYLIDGRFRVASFVQSLLHAGEHSLLAIHDFAARPHYHAVHEVAEEIARCETLSVFRRGGRFDRARATDILLRHAADPA